MLTEIILDHPFLTIVAMLAVELVALRLMCWALGPEKWR